MEDLSVKNYLDEWKDIQDVYIPQANTIGFQESVIIRDYIPPRETSVFIVAQLSRQKSKIFIMN